MMLLSSRQLTLYCDFRIMLKIWCIFGLYFRNMRIRILLFSLICGFPVFAQCFTSVASGYNHSLAIKSDGTLWSWGQNQYGQLADMTNINKNSPVQIGTDDGWIYVAGGGSHSLAIKSDGTLWGWGLNDRGQIGDGTTVNKNEPVQIGTDTNWQTVSLGFDYSFALKTDGSLWGWGRNSLHQLGMGIGLRHHFPCSCTSYSDRCRR
ncbi:MAG TPA: hypothetical protein VGB44_12710 [Flavobacterium sp.]|jgi:alpha-tubulin suppressor-like RCC1 family protein